MSLPRAKVFAFVYLLLATNALTTFVGMAALDHGWFYAALNLFDVSAIVWLGLVAGLMLLWQANGEPARPADFAMLGLAILAALLPVPSLSSAMLTLAALWGWRSASPTAPLRRASLILLSLTAFLLWGRIGLAWGAGPLLEGDARFVAILSGMNSVGNSVYFTDGTTFLIAPGCSSLHGISLALILWTTAVQYFAIAPGRRVWLTLAMAVFGSVLVNGLRLSVIAWNPREFDYWHVGTGGALFGWLALIVITGVVYRGLADARRLV